MSAVVRWGMVLLVLLTGLAPAPARGAGQEAAGVLDLAAVPVPPEQLPEAGFQMMTGGFLDLPATAAWLASPRADVPQELEAALEDHGWEQTYMLDLVLLDDRANADSPILAMVQTNLYDFADDGGADDAFARLATFAADVAVLDAPLEAAVTVQQVTASGDTIRTLARVHDVLVEVVSLEVYQQADADRHAEVVIATVDRLVTAREAGGGIAARALRIADGARVPSPIDAPQTGIHQLYRLAEGVVRPAAGELVPPAPEALAPGLVELYQAGQRVRLERGEGLVSSWIGVFADEARARAFVERLPASTSGALLPDPYFRLWEEEQAVAQGVAGLYRVSGTTPEGDRFSGTLEVRQHRNHVVGIGWRTLGAALPPVDVTSRLVDAQLACLDTDARCVPVPVEDLLMAATATPVVTVPAGSVRSAEFGWTLGYDPDHWELREHVVEPGYDYAQLVGGLSTVTLESVIDHHGDPEQCVLDELQRLQALEEHAVITLGSDVADEVPAGLQPGHGWAIYTVEPLAEERADQEYTIRIDCYTLVPEAASLVMTHTAPRERWEDERNRGERLRDQLLLPDNGAAARAPGRAGGYHWRHMDAMISKLWIDRAA